MKNLLILFLTCAAVLGQSRPMSYDNTTRNVAPTDLDYVGASGNFTTLQQGGVGVVTTARTITIAGTANQITSSAGAQDLSGNRTWTLSLPTSLTFTGFTITGGTYSSPTIGTPTFTGAAIWPDNVRQTFNPGADAAGINVGSHAGNPGTPVNGDLWYNSSSGALNARINGATVALGAGGGGSAPVGTMVSVGASTQYALPYYTDTTGTNMAPSLLTTDSTLTNFFAGGFYIDTLTVTNPIPVTSGGLGIASGTSGGIPYFSSGTTIASSAALAANALVIGGGAGAAPSTTTTGAGILTWLGTPSSANLASAVTGETGSGALVFGTSPTIGTATFSGAQTLSEGASVALDPAGSADGAFTGITIAGTAGATLAFGDLIVLDVTDSRWELADANSAASADGDSRGMIGICVLAAAGDGSATTILLQGVVRADTAFPAMTVNNNVFISETAGDVTQTSPTTEDNVVRILGTAITADEIYFDPDRTYVIYDAP